MLVTELLIAELVAVLKLNSVIILHGNKAEDRESWDPTFLSTLHERGVTTQMMDWTFWTSDNLTTTTHDCLPSGASSFIVLGQPAFVFSVFTQVTSCTIGSDRKNALSSTEWITTIPDENLTDFVAEAKPFENCAVIVRSKVTGKASLWTIRHMLDDVKLTFVTSLPSTNCQSPFCIFPNLRHDLGGRRLRVVVKPWDFVLSVTEVDGQNVYKGLIMEIFRELASTLNFSYILMPPVDDSWGQELDNGQWDGPIGMLTRQEADMAIGFFSITPERSEVVDPTTPYLYDNSAIIFRKSGARADNQWRFFIQPFQTRVYAVIAGSLVVVLLLLLTLQKSHWSLTGRKEQGIASSGRVECLQLVMMDFEILLAGLVNRPAQIDSSSSAAWVLLMTWMLLGVILTSAYSSQLTSSLTVSQPDLPFTSLADLLAQDTFKFGIVSGTAYYSLLKNSTVKDYRTFYEKVQKFAKVDPDVLSSDIEVHKLKVMTEKYASLQGSQILSSGWSSEACGMLSVLPETLSTTSFGFYLQKGSPYTTLISKQIGLMVDSGLVSKWKQWSLPENRECQRQEEQSGRVIGLPDTHTAFLMAAVGLGLALAALGVEIKAYVLQL